MPFFKTRLKNEAGEFVELEQGKVIDKVLRVSAKPRGEDARDTILLDRPNDEKYAVLATIDNRAIAVGEVSVNKVHGEVFSHSAIAVVEYFIVECTFAWAPRDTALQNKSVYKALACLPCGLRQLVEEELDNAHLTQERYRKMTEMARAMQKRHLDNHNGDVYHAMQRLCVETGMRTNEPALKVIPLKKD